MKVGKSFRIRSSTPILNIKDFSKHFYKDPEIDRLTKESFLYFIVQRPIHSFENIQQQGNNLIFDIEQKTNESKLKIKLPLYQEGIFTKEVNDFIIEFQSDFDKIINDNDRPVNVHSIKLYKDDLKKENFVKLLTPEWIIRDYYTDTQKMEVEGDITNFLTYKVHYIGISTKQEIKKRVKSHSSLQSILSEIESLVGTVMNSIELGVIFLELQGSSQYNMFTSADLANEQNINQFVDALTRNAIESDKTIFKDAEKAFVSALTTHYNEIKYITYPQKHDLLNDKNLTFITYEFNDPLNLIFENMNFNSANGDLIIVTQENKAQIIKFQK